MQIDVQNFSQIVSGYDRRLNVKSGVSNAEGINI